MRRGIGSSVIAATVTCISTVCFFLQFKLPVTSVMFGISGTIAALAFPGLYPGLVITGAMEGSSHGGRNNAAILAISVPINFVFYFSLTFAIWAAIAFLLGHRTKATQVTKVQGPG